MLLNGRHHNPLVLEHPQSGMRVFTPGALLRNGMGGDPADLAEVTNGDGARD